MSCFEDEMVILPVSSTKQGLNEDEIGPGRLFSDAEIRLTVQSESYENRGTNTVHIPTKQG